MNQKLNISIDTELYKSSDNTEALLEASRRLFSSTDLDFEKMKAEKWYNRIWAMVTFSKDNEKRTARNISSLAKAQDIVLRVLLKLSEEDMKFAQALHDNSEDIFSLSGIDEKLAKKLKSMDNQIRFGVSNSKQLYDLEDSKKVVLLNVLYQIAEKHNDKETIGRYVNAISSYMKMKLSPADANVLEMKSLDVFTIEEAKNILPVLIEFNYACTGELYISAEFENLIDHLHISNNERVKLAKFTVSQIELQGMEGIINIYKSIGVDMAVTDQEIELDDFFDCVRNHEDEFFYIHDCINDSSENVDSDARSYSERTKGEYPELRKLIVSYIPKISKCFSTDEKELKKYISKNCPEVDIDTSIGINDISLMQYDRGLLFTTAAFYWLDTLEKRNEVRRCLFSEIVSVKTQQRAKKGKRTDIELRILQKNGVELVIENQILIDLSRLEQLIMGIMELNDKNLVAITDMPVRISKMSSMLKLHYVELLSVFAQTSDTRAHIYKIISELEFSEDERWYVMRRLAIHPIDIYKWISKIEMTIPHGSRRSLRYLIMSELASIIYMSDGVMNKEKYELFKTVARSFRISEGELGPLIDFAAIPTRIMEGKIKEKQIGEITKAVTVVTASAGIPLYWAMGPSVLMWSSVFANFVPILNTFIFGGFIIKSFFKAHAEKETFKEKRLDTIFEVKAKYEELRGKIKEDTSKIERIASNDLGEIVSFLGETQSGIDKYINKMYDYLSDARP